MSKSLLRERKKNNCITVNLNIARELSSWLEELLKFNFVTHTLCCLVFQASFCGTWLKLCWIKSPNFSWSPNSVSRSLKIFIVATLNYNFSSLKWNLMLFPVFWNKRSYCLYFVLYDTLHKVFPISSNVSRLCYKMDILYHN